MALNIDYSWKYICKVSKRWDFTFILVVSPKEDIFDIHPTDQKHYLGPHTPGQLQRIKRTHVTDVLWHFFQLYFIFVITDYWTSISICLGSLSVRILLQPKLNQQVRLNGLNRAVMPNVNPICIELKFGLGFANKWQLSGLLPSNRQQLLFLKVPKTVVSWNLSPGIAKVQTQLKLI